MVRKLLLLTGLHRTGTTSIQMTCVQNRHRLRSLGFDYPPQLHGQQVGHWAGNHCFLLQFLFKRRRDGFLTNSFNRSVVERHFRQYFAEQGNLNAIMVAEVVSNFSIEELRDLKSWFVGLGFKIEPFCCLRNLLDWFNSRIAQYVTPEVNEPLSIREAIRIFQKSGSVLRRRVTNLAHVFPDIEFYSFDKLIEQGSNPVTHFLARSGIDASKYTALKTNESASEHSVRLASKIWEEVRERLRTPEDRQRFFIENRFLFQIPGRKFRLRHSEVVPVLPILIEENEWIRGHFEASFCNEVRFEEDMPVLEDEARHYLSKALGTIDEPFRTVIGNYVEEHTNSQLSNANS